MDYESELLLEEMMLNEVYFGKTESIQAIEDQLRIVRHKFIGTKYNPSTDPEMLKLNRMIEKQFGFGRFALTIELDPMPEAMTIPISYNFNYTKKQSDYNIEPTTYKFKKEYNYTCIVIMTTGLFFNRKFSTEEIMACLLYELGHNFYSCMSDDNGILSSIYSATLIANKISDVVTTFQFNKSFADIVAADYANKRNKDFNTKFNDPEIKKLFDTMPDAEIKATKQLQNSAKAAKAVSIGIAASDALAGAFSETREYIETQRDLKKVYHSHKPTKKVMYGLKDVMNIVWDQFKSGFNTFGEIYAKLRNAGLKVNLHNIIQCINVIDLLVPYKDTIDKAKNPLTWITLPVGYKVENAAANFATMYGYGAAEISYFNKMESITRFKFAYKFIKKHPQIGVVVNAIATPSKILNGVFDTKPTGISSSYDQIRMLKAELRKANLDPEMKANIENDLDMCEKNLKKLTDISKGVEDPDICRHLYNKAMSDWMDGVGLKDALLVDRDKFKKYDKNMIKKGG